MAGTTNMANGMSSELPGSVWETVHDQYENQRVTFPPVFHYQWKCGKTDRSVLSDQSVFMIMNHTENLQLTDCILLYNLSLIITSVFAMDNSPFPDFFTQTTRLTNQTEITQLTSICTDKFLTWFWWGPTSVLATDNILSQDFSQHFDNHTTWLNMWLPSSFHTSKNLWMVKVTQHI